MKLIALMFAGICLLGCSQEIEEGSPSMMLPTEIIDLGILVTEDIPESLWGKRFLADMGFDRNNAFEVIDWEYAGGAVTGSNAYLTLFNHGGPHVDAPNHVGLGAGIDSYDIEAFVGPLKVIDAAQYGPGRTVPVEAFTGQDIQPGDIVIMYTAYQPPQSDDEYPQIIFLTREAAEYRQGKARDAKLALQQASKLEDMFSKMQDAASATISVIIKSDVHGSAEALSDSLTKLSNEEVKVKVLSSGVGGITETDATLAAASNAVIIGFNVRADAAARSAIKESGVDVRYYSIIYEAIDDVKAALSGLLAPEIREQIVGLAEVKEVFSSPKFGDIAGCIVTEGFVKRSNPIRVLRENVVIYEGELESLRRFKDDVNEVRSGTECGIGVKNYSDVRVGDQIECYERIEVARTLD